MRGDLNARLARAPGQLALLWAGLSAGVAFLATPVKFLAPSLTLPVALDVGRHTFRAYNQVEIGLLVAAAALSLPTPAERRRLPLWAVPAGIVALQGLWLLPELDARVLALQQGAPPPPSPLHKLYIASEALMLLWLLGAGLSDGAVRENGRRRSARAPRRATHL